MQYSAANDVLHRFVDTLYAEDDLIELRPIEIWREGASRCSRLIEDWRRWLSPCAILDCFDDLYALNLAEGANIFMGVNPRTRAGGGTKADVAVCRSVWADLDGVSAVEAASRWSELRLPSPTITVNSGTGAHLYWILDSAVPVTEVTARSRFEGMLKALNADLGSDPTSDVSRLLRLPGFWNVKDFRLGSRPTACRLVHCNRDVRYPLSLFERWFEVSEPQPPPVPVAADSPSTDDAQIQKLAARLDVEVRDRSARDFAIVCELLRLGLTKEEIWQLVRGKSKFDTRGREYFERTFYNAAFYANRLYSL